MTHADQDPTVARLQAQVDGLTDLVAMLVAQRDEANDWLRRSVEQTAAAEAEVARLREALAEAIAWIEGEDPYEDPHDVVRQRFVDELGAALAPKETP